MGISVFEEYDVNSYKVSIVESIKENNIKKVFLNLADTSLLASLIKKQFGDSIKVILCSHGNESGDFLHQSVRFKPFLPWIKRVTSPWRLGRILQKELEFRLAYFDLILTVSEIEYALEYWLGAKHAFYVPRIFKPDYIPWNPVNGRLGFISDLSHYPNYYGISSLCKAISEQPDLHNIEIRLVGKHCKNVDDLLEQYTFLSFVGYLDDAELRTEASTWMYYLNLVFYFSKGVSTKMAKGMNWGLPVISTIAGNRGYIFKQGGVVTATTPHQLAKIIKHRAFDRAMAKEDKDNVLLAVESYKDINKIMDDLYPVIEKL